MDIHSKYLLQLLILCSRVYFLKCLSSASARDSSRARHWSMDVVNDTLFNAAPNVEQPMTQTNRCHVK